MSLIQPKIAGFLRTTCFGTDRNARQTLREYAPRCFFITRADASPSPAEQIALPGRRLRAGISAARIVNVVALSINDFSAPDASLPLRQCSRNSESSVGLTRVYPAVDQGRSSGYKPLTSVMGGVWVLVCIFAAACSPSPSLYRR